MGIEVALSCNHFVHKNCLVQHFKAECPLCRTPVQIQVTGTKPLPDNILYIPEDIEEDNSSSSDEEDDDDDNNNSNVFGGDLESSRCSDDSQQSEIDYPEDETNGSEKTDYLYWSRC
jgi:hypothetical protein